MVVTDVAVSPLLPPQALSARAIAVPIIPATVFAPAFLRIPMAIPFKGAMDIDTVDRAALRSQRDQR
jgi:hypothetical protein